MNITSSWAATGTEVVYYRHKLNISVLNFDRWYHCICFQERRGFLVTRKRSRTPFCQSGNPLKIEFHPQTKDNLKNYLNNVCIRLYKGRQEWDLISRFTTSLMMVCNLIGPSVTLAKHWDRFSRSRTADYFIKIIKAYDVCALLHTTYLTHPNLVKWLAYTILIDAWPVSQTENSV